jgi:hypothetical protein
MSSTAKKRFNSVALHLIDPRARQWLNVTGHTARW